MNEKKIKHLELIQAVINRMANNSFLIKGWCVTLVAAILALANKDMNRGFIVVIFIPILMFWFLDTFFLKQEKLFRDLYNEVRLKNEDEIDFSMKTNRNDWFKKNIQAAFSITICPFYGFMALATLFAIALLFDQIKF